MQIAHITHLRADDIGELTPADLLAAADMFDALYRNRSEG